MSGPGNQWILKNPTQKDATVPDTGVDSFTLATSFCLSVPTFAAQGGDANMWVDPLAIVARVGLVVPTVATGGRDAKVPNVGVDLLAY